MTDARTLTARRAAPRKRLSPASLQTIAAAAPSVTGEHMSKVSGYAIGADAMTSSIENGF